MMKPASIGRTFSVALGLVVCAMTPIAQAQEAIVGKPIERSVVPPAKVSSEPAGSVNAEPITFGAPVEHQTFDPKTETPAQSTLLVTKPIPVWAIEAKDLTLARALARWVEASGKTLVWNATKERKAYPATYQATDLVAVLQQVMLDLDASNDRLRACVYRNAVVIQQREQVCH